MKKYIFLFAIAGIGFTSCLDYDSPGDEIKKTDVLVEDVVYHGKADSIDYHRFISEKGFAMAADTLLPELGQMLTAQYAMRGGKQGDMPGPHAYQYQFTMCVDNYAGYAVLPHKFAEGTGGSLSSTYDINDSYTGGANGSYSIVRNGLVQMLNHPLVDSIPEFKAFGLLLFDYSSQEVADIYGPFPYIEYKANKQDHPFVYNDLRDIYRGIVDNLDTINACFAHYSQRPQWYKDRMEALLKKYDVIGKIHSVENLRLLANSLKLRMAMHVVKVEPALAKRWAEEAVAAGVITSKDQQAGLFPNDIGFTNPLVEISETWGDTRLNASFESILESLGHPYLSYLYKKNGEALSNAKTGALLKKNTRIVGLRAGLLMDAGQSYSVNQREGYSRLDKRVIATAPLYLMKLAEVDFLRAEGALRGWNMGGTAESFYYAGIDAAGLEDPDMPSAYSALVDDYKKLEKANAYTYVDPMDSLNNIASVTTIGVKWNEADDNEIKLEKIITQKYITLFPYSFEAWTEVRRTGYPKLFPVLNPDDGDGSLAFGDLIRRAHFPGSAGASVAADIAATGLKALGGPDLQSTRLWWDVAGANF
jgi:hypothetical protein